MSRIICKDLHLKCFKRRRAQKLTDANCAARMKRAKLMLQKSPQYATDLFSLRNMEKIQKYQNLWTKTKFEATKMQFVCVFSTSAEKLNFLFPKVV